MIKNIPFIILFLTLTSCKQYKPFENNPKPPTTTKPITEQTWNIENGKFYLDGKWKFLKIGKWLVNFADPAGVDNVIAGLGQLKAKKYDVLEINCYWYQFDNDGDGNIDVSLAPLNKLINAVLARNMIPSLSVETYSVGGGFMPSGFWTRFPDAFAINDKGQRVKDTEYGVGSDVVSIFHPGYRAAAHNFIKNLARGIDTKKILWFETTVEPQYMGVVNLDYSDAAKAEYTKWLAANNITDPASQMPAAFPIPQTFVNNANWNKFRAQFLAKWVNDDAKAFREIAGANAYVAVDYLDAEESTMRNRMGDPQEFLNNLTEANIIQVNWSWYFPTNTPNNKAYQRVKKAKADYNRNWAITEHMTFNGSDYNNYSDAVLNDILMNTLRQGTGFGWEFVSVGNVTASDFSMYNNDWSPKKVIRYVDNNWDGLMQKVEEIAK